MPPNTPPVPANDVTVTLDQDAIGALHALVATNLAALTLQVAMDMQLRDKGELGVQAARTMVVDEFAYWRTQVSK